MHGWPEPLAHQNIYYDSSTCPERDRRIQWDGEFRQPRDFGYEPPIETVYYWENNRLQERGATEVLPPTDIECTDTCATNNDWVCEFLLTQTYLVLRGHADLSSQVMTEAGGRTPRRALSELSNPCYRFEYTPFSVHSCMCTDPVVATAFCVAQLQRL